MSFLFKQLSDEKFYKKLDGDRTEKHQQKISREVRKLIKADKLPKEAESLIEDDPAQTHVVSSVINHLN